MGVATLKAVPGLLKVGARALLDLALPRCCVCCEAGLDGAEVGIVCGACWSRVSFLPSPRCSRCGHPRQARSGACRGELRDCQWCATLPSYVRSVRSVCWEDGIARRLVHALKYDGWHAVAEPMAARMARLDWPADVRGERTALVPVPLASPRERERGYNQSTRLATALAPYWGIPVWERALERHRATASQTRLTPDERRRNVCGAFRAAAETRGMLRGAHVVLVDDVVTTAATLNACAAALVAGGARIVSFVTFGRAPAAGDR